MSDELFTQGQAALRVGDKQKARQIFQSIVQKDPQNEKAWLWLAGSTETNFERALYLERALEINPGNTPARRELDKVRAAMLEHTPAPVQLASTVAIPSGSAIGKPAHKTKLKPKRKKLTIGKIIYWGFFSILALLAAGLVLVWIIEGGIPALFRKSEKLPTVKPALYMVTYEVTGSAMSAKIEYFIGGDESMLGNSVLPFEKQQTLKAKDLAYVSAENNDETGSVICRIWVNGKIWKESRKAGAFAKVECNGIVKGYDWPP